MLTPAITNRTWAKYLNSNSTIKTPSAKISGQTCLIQVSRRPIRMGRDICRVSKECRSNRDPFHRSWCSSQISNNKLRVIEILIYPIWILLDVPTRIYPKIRVIWPKGLRVACSKRKSRKVRSGVLQITPGRCGKTWRRGLIQVFLKIGADRPWMNMFLSRSTWTTYSRCTRTFLNIRWSQTSTSRTKIWTALSTTILIPSRSWKVKCSLHRLRTNWTMSDLPTQNSKLSRRCSI